MFLFSIVCFTTGIALATGFCYIFEPHNIKNTTSHQQRVVSKLITYVNDEIKIEQNPEKTNVYYNSIIQLKKLSDMIEKPSLSLQLKLLMVSLWSAHIDIIKMLFEHKPTVMQLIEQYSTMFKRCVSLSNIAGVFGNDIYIKSCNECDEYDEDECDEDYCDEDYCDEDECDDEDCDEDCDDDGVKDVQPVEPQVEPKVEPGESGESGEDLKDVQTVIIDESDENGLYCKHCCQI